MPAAGCAPSQQEVLVVLVDLLVPTPRITNSDPGYQYSVQRGLMLCTHTCHFCFLWWSLCSVLR